MQLHKCLTPNLVRLNAKPFLSCSQWLPQNVQSKFIFHPIRTSSFYFVKKSSLKFGKIYVFFIIGEKIIFLIHGYRVLGAIGGFVKTTEHDELCSILINLSLTTGVTFQMIRFFVQVSVETRTNMNDFDSLYRTNSRRAQREIQVLSCVEIVLQAN